MELLESRRSLLEDLEIIEDAIASRIDRNPELYYSYVKKRVSLFDENDDVPPPAATNSNRIYKRKKMRRSRKQMVLQQHEINFFLLECFQKLKKLGSLNEPINTEALEDSDSDFKAFMSGVKDINDKFEKEDSAALDINEKISQYAMFSASTTKSHPRTILSRKALKLKLNDIFSRDEQYGETLDLQEFHTEWFNVIKSTDCSLLQFINILELFLDDEKYLLDAPFDRKNERYFSFLEQLSKYLESFFKKSYVLIDQKLLEKNIKADFRLYLETPIANKDKGFYSVASCRWFKTEAVFKSYLTGKSHKKNVVKRYDGLLGEYKVHRYLNLLLKELKQTKEFIERKLAFTAEERIEEMAKLNENYESPDYGPDETEEDNKNTISGSLKNSESKNQGTSLDLPLGPDGLPIPFWLYKLQGLDVSYTCEICGNTKFQGRRAFEKHFIEPMHMFRLRCLGVDPSPVFKGITGIAEALDLSKQVAAKKDNTRNPARSENKIEVEVEDEEGNVIPKKLYEELRKQGLV